MTSIHDLFYAGHTGSSFPFVFRTEAERNDWLAVNKNGFVIETSQVDPELRRQDAEEFSRSSL
jgi:hypothetical protein